MSVTQIWLVGLQQLRNCTDARTDSLLVQVSILLQVSSPPNGGSSGWLIMRAVVWCTFSSWIWSNWLWITWKSRDPLRPDPLGYPLVSGIIFNIFKSSFAQATIVRTRCCNHFSCTLVAFWSAGMKAYIEGREGHHLTWYTLVPVMCVLARWLGVP
jgi:hypothetical protein